MILFNKRILPFILMFVLLFSYCVITPSAVTETSLSYSFSGLESDKAGYAEGKITLTASTYGEYKLLWSDDQKALAGYSPIAENMKLNAGESKSFSFGNHTAIPKDATGVIAVDKNGSEVARYDIPKNKRLNASSGKLLYTFNSYSDIHIDKDSNGVFYTEASKRWAQALKFGVQKNTDFIVTSGDTVTNATGPDDEWDEYERILSESDYVNPVWESDGNHDMRCGESSGLKSFIRATGTDSTAANYDSNKPYYYMIEKKSGDVFIFMALEGSSKSDATESSQFSDAQLNWLDNLLENYYDSGVNVYIIEHSPINGFGAGDRMSNPYYKGHIREKFDSTKRFKEVLKNYPGLIFMSGHSHEDFLMGYNYSNENNTACNMIHNPSVAGTTIPNNPDDGKLDYNGGKGSEGKGKGLNSQGYYVEVYDNEVIYYGANLLNGLIYPSYSYIMEGSRTPTPIEEETDATSAVTDSSSESIAETSEPVAETSTAAATVEETESETAATETAAAESTEPTTEPAAAYKIGDVNLDDLISIRDATLIQKAVARFVTLTKEQEKLADTDFNGSVNVKDATLIQKYLAKIIRSFEEEAGDKKSKTLSGASTFSSELSAAKQVLSSNYTFSSYDQYQNLKALYYAYKNTSPADEDAAAEQLVNARNKLTEIVTHIKGSAMYLVGDEYYFENNNNWGTVYAYAWSGGNHNAEWPGAKLSKVGTQSGHDVYKIKFNSPGQYSFLIFSNGTDQTVDIDLQNYSANCFCLNGTNSSGKYKVKNFSYATEPDNLSKYAMYYYTASHKWGYETESKLTDNGDGTYSLKYVCQNSDNLSLCIYNTSSNVYNCVSSSESLNYEAGKEMTYSLSAADTRGSSVTIKELSSGKVINLLYTASTKQLKVTCG